MKNIEDILIETYGVGLKKDLTPQEYDVMMLGDQEISSSIPDSKSSKMNFIQNMLEKYEQFDEHRSFWEQEEERLVYSKDYKRKNKEKLKKQQRNRRKRIKENPPYMQVSYFLREALKNLDENQSWLAEQVGISRERVSKYLNGIYLPRETEIRERLCEVLRVRSADLESLIGN